MAAKALMIRVGVDTVSGGYLGTINKNNEFDWRSIPGHSDPTWDELSYGDEGDATKIKQLVKLKLNDLLIFYAGLINPQGEKAIYIIGYYIIKKVFDMRELTVKRRVLLRDKEIMGLTNPHLHKGFIDKPKKRNILILGEKGGLLKYGIKIGHLVQVKNTARYYIDEDYYYLGFKGDLTQSGSCRKVDYNAAYNLIIDKEIKVENNSMLN